MAPTRNQSNKKWVDEWFYTFFNGRLYLDKKSNTHKWVISSKEDILMFYAYLQTYPLRSFKQKRVLLIPAFLRLRSSWPLIFLVFSLKKVFW